MTDQLASPRWWATEWQQRATIGHLQALVRHEAELAYRVEHPLAREESFVLLGISTWDYTILYVAVIFRYKAH